MLFARYASTPYRLLYWPWLLSQSGYIPSTKWVGGVGEACDENGRWQPRVKHNHQTTTHRRYVAIRCTHRSVHGTRYDTLTSERHDEGDMRHRTGEGTHHVQYALGDFNLNGLEIVRTAPDSDFRTMRYSVFQNTRRPQSTWSIQVHANKQNQAQSNIIPSTWNGATRHERVRNA